MIIHAGILCKEMYPKEPVDNTNYFLEMLVISVML